MRMSICLFAFLAIVCAVAMAAPAPDARITARADEGKQI